MINLFTTLLFLLLNPATTAHSDESPAPAPLPVPASMTRVCPEEDSVNCQWNAGDLGNGEGHSFIVRQLPGKKGMVCVFYIKAQDAHLDYCS